MITCLQGKPLLRDTSYESSVLRSTHRARAVEDYALSSDWLHVQRHLSLLPYVVDLQAQINMLREQLETLEQQRDELLAQRSMDENFLTLELEIESTGPGRIVEEIDTPFYYFGGEADE